MPQITLPAACALLCLSVLAGCDTFYRYLAYPAADRAVPDAKYSYLIADSRVVPERDGQLTSIHIRKYGGGVHDLQAGIPVYAIVPERYELTRIHFAHPSDSEDETRFLQRRIRFKTRPGVVYYLGIIELVDRDENFRIRIVRDEDLYRRACEYAPAVFEIFPLEYIRDEDSDTPFAPCNSDSADPAPDFASGSGR